MDNQFYERDVPADEAMLSIILLYIVTESKYIEDKAAEHRIF